MRLSALILAGGKARRMQGRNKSFLNVEGRAIIETQLELLQGIAEMCFVSTPSPKAFAHLDVECTSDALGGQGPMDGIAGALKQCSTPWCMVVGGDMPHISLPVVELLIQKAHASAPSPAFVVPRVRGEIEPLCALYHQRCYPLMKLSLDAGALSMRDFCKTHADEHHGFFVDEAALSTVDPELKFKNNINSQNDLLQFGG